MLDAHVDSLPDDAVSDSLVDDDSDSALGDVEDASGLAVVELVGHSEMLGGVGFDVDVLSDFEVGEVFGDADGTVVAEGLLVEVSGSRVETEAVRHLSLIIIKIPPEGAIKDSVDNASKMSELAKRRKIPLPQRYRSNTVIPQAAVASLIIREKGKGIGNCHLRIILFTLYAL